MSGKDERPDADDQVDTPAGDAGSDGAATAADEAPTADHAGADDPDGADDQTDDGADAEADDADPAPARKPNWLVLGAAALAVVTTAAAVWFGISWISAANDDDLALDRTRDEVSRVAEAAVVTLNTLDYRDPDKSLDQWEAAVTGDLYNDIHNGRKGADAKIAEGRTSTSAKVLKLAVTSLNDHEGTAQVMTAVSWTKAVDGKAPESEYRRYQASLLRTDTGWKVNGIAQVPYNPGT